MATKHPSEVITGEEDLSTQHYTAQAYPRFPCPHGHPCRTAGVVPAAAKRTAAALRLTGVTATAPAVDGLGLPKQARLLEPSAFRRVTARGQRRTSPCFILYAAPGLGGATSRLGLTVSRKVGKAVVRNRVKRVAREFFRHQRQRLGADRDWVLIARPRAGQASGDLLRHDLQRVFLPPGGEGRP